MHLLDLNCLNVNLQDFIDKFTKFYFILTIYLHKHIRLITQIYLFIGKGFSPTHESLIS